MERDREAVRRKGGREGGKGLQQGGKVGGMKVNVCGQGERKSKKEGS